MSEALACGHNRPRYCRNLCASCYTVRWQRGEFKDDRLYKRGSEVAEEYEALKAQGYGNQEITRLLGYTKWDSLRAILRRHYRKQSNG